MYGSYGSYSSMSSTTAPVDIGVHRSSTHQAAACAFPSWPRRTSLSESEGEPRATSYLSDEDLFPSDPFEDSDARSVSSAGTGSPAATPPALDDDDALDAAGPTEEQLLELQRERQAYQREVVRFLLGEKERRRQAAKRARRGSNGSSTSKKASPKSKLNSMTPIAEAGGE